MITRPNTNESNLFKITALSNHHTVKNAEI